MRHRVSGKKLNRSTKHRKALYKNLIAALISHGQITTTEAKAKAVRSAMEKLITKGKKNTIQAKKEVAKYFGNRQTTKQLTKTVLPQIKRVSGYTKITRLGRRKGDNSMMARLEIIDYKKEDKKAKPSKAEKKPKSKEKTKEKSKNQAKK